MTWLGNFRWSPLCIYLMRYNCALFCSIVKCRYNSYRQLMLHDRNVGRITPLSMLYFMQRCGSVCWMLASWLEKTLSFVTHKARPANFNKTFRRGWCEDSLHWVWSSRKRSNKVTMLFADWNANTQHATLGTESALATFRYHNLLIDFIPTSKVLRKGSGRPYVVTQRVATDLPWTWRKPYLRSANTQDGHLLCQSLNCIVAVIASAVVSICA